MTEEIIRDRNDLQAEELVIFERFAAAVSNGLAILEERRLHMLEPEPELEPDNVFSKLGHIVTKLINKQ